LNPQERRFNSRRDDAGRDTALPWGSIRAEGVFRPLPKGPMLAAGFGPPPFKVTLPIGEVRHVIEQPAALPG
jgi:hypothetical protein